MKFSNTILLLLLLLLLCSCEKHIDHLRYFDGKMKIGDNRQWAEPAYNDESWPSYIDTNGKGIFWERMPVEILDRPDFQFENVVLIGAVANFDAYFDGVFIGNNTGLAEGELSSDAGTFETSFLIPDSLNTFGKHLLAMRYHRVETDQSFRSYSIIGYYRSMLRVPLQISKFMFLVAGIYLIIGIYYFLLGMNVTKDWAAFIFSLICILYFSLLMMEYLKLYQTYPYTFQLTRLKIIAWLNMAVAFFIPVYFSLQFSFPWKKILTAVLFTIIAGLFLQNKFGGYDDLAKYHNTVMWIFSCIIVGYACIKKQAFAPVVLSGLILAISVILWLPNFRFPFVSSFDISLFVSFTILILSILVASSLKRNTERKAYEESLLLSEKLKTELLKKNIRPHFIMNTLTSMMDWVEESPKEGVKFIGSLADEFEILNDIADHKLVPIDQEIKLCKSHLSVMGFRKEVKYIWEEEGIDRNEIIPPAIIHTAVENGVTHSIPNERGEIKFILSFEKTKKFKRYILQTFAVNRKVKANTITDGTGTKYIKSRLKESFGDAWELNSNSTDFGWQTEFKIYL